MLAKHGYFKTYLWYDECLKYKFDSILGKLCPPTRPLMISVFFSEDELALS